MNSPYRLPITVIPTRYDLEIWPDLQGTTFEGSVLITVEIAERCSQILLNAVGLKVQNVWALPKGGNQQGRIPASVSEDEELERITLNFDQELQPGQAQINLRFTGNFNEQLVGFYQSRFTSREDAEPVEQVLAVTQFESTHARRCFPCFDEPAFKAVFSVTLTVPDDVLAVSNSSQIEREELDGSLARITFADTMVMSTYLVAFVIGPLQATAPRMVSGINGPIPLRVIFPPGSQDLCEFALDVAEAGLKFFEDYYGIAYPGDKVDLVAVPDFAFGAMENLGCITFREVLLLVDPTEATQPELQRVADVINHELAHMWFGDLVTMKWWNGIWLNEAFATFMEITATNSLRPDWDVWTSFGLARAAAFDTDALTSTRPIEFEVISPAEAEAMFDILTYEKGASVVRMLEQYLGAEIFRSGIRQYLQQHSYGVTE
ncbi:MAG: M1 family metallopeptidase, partial [Microthrixaceae bacterium]